MPFKITITKLEDKAVVEHGPHTLLEKRPWTQEELSDAHQFAFSGDKQKFLDGTPMKEVYGYAPARSVVRESAANILEQTVPDLDLAAVIKAINKL